MIVSPSNIFTHIILQLSRNRVVMAEHWNIRSRLVIFFFMNRPILCTQVFNWEYIYIYIYILGNEFKGFFHIFKKICFY